MPEETTTPAVKQGYYTDTAGNVLGYWTAEEKPVKDGLIYIESDTRPALTVIPPKKGYYTDKAGTVLGYFELKEVPANTAEYDFIEAAELPPVPLTAEQEEFKATTAVKIAREAALDALISGDAAKIAETKATLETAKTDLEAVSTIGPVEEGTI